MKFSAGLLIFALAASVAGFEEWTNPEGTGNVRAEIGDNKVNFGHNYPWEALDHIKEGCPSNGCNSESKIELPADVVTDGELVGATLIISVEGSFNNAGEKGNRDELVEMAKAVIAASKYDYDEAVKYHTGNGCSSAGSIPCSPGQTETIMQFGATSLVVIRVEDDKGAQLADLSISISVDVPELGGGVCETITTVGGAAAGAINGIAGGLFTLAGLACE